MTDQLDVANAMYLATYGEIPLQLAFDIALRPEKVKRALELNPSAIVEVTRKHEGRPQWTLT
jgi:hypothetical protein